MCNAVLDYCATVSLMIVAQAMNVNSVQVFAPFLHLFLEFTVYHMAINGNTDTPWTSQPPPPGDFSRGRSRRDVVDLKLRDAFQCDRQGVHCTDGSCRVVHIGGQEEANDLSEEQCKRTGAGPTDQTASLDSDEDDSDEEPAQMEDCFDLQLDETIIARDPVESMQTIVCWTQ